MGRPRGFDEHEAVDAAVALFAGRAYDGVSIDDVVGALGVHRNSLYKTFGSKRGLYLAALRRAVDRDVRPVAARLAAAGDQAREACAVARGDGVGPGFDLVLLAAAEQAPADPAVAVLVAEALTELTGALGGPDQNPDDGQDAAARLLGLRLLHRSRTTLTKTQQEVARWPR